MASLEARLHIQHNSNIDKIDIEADNMLRIVGPADTNDTPASDVDSEDENNKSRKPHEVSEKRMAQINIFNEYVNMNARKIFRAVRKDELAHANSEQISITDMLAKHQTETIKDPREYQMELFERAKKENLIAVLDTGSGKTLIAVLLLRHVLDKELEDRAANLALRVSFFLVIDASTCPYCHTKLVQVPSIALVFQQFSVVECNLDHKIARRYGNMDSYGLEKKAWDKHLKNDMVIVCTADILHQCLIHSFVKMEQINLLIFDEAHHAKKNHPYAKCALQCPCQNLFTEIGPLTKH
jgi:endoribonuclease Dicer